MVVGLHNRDSVPEGVVPTRTSRKVRIGLIGCGTVGSEVARALLARNFAEAHQLTRIAVRHVDKDRSVAIPPGTLTGQALEVVKDPEIDLVVELMTGVDLPRTLIRQALVERKSVVTANKEVVALHGEEFAKLAQERDVGFYFEGAVGGAVPMVATVTDVLAGDRIGRFVGILNGTTNYILTSVSRDHLEVSQSIKEAQKAGFAETDPTQDLNGSDAGRKAAILATLAFGSRVIPADVFTRGIEDLSLDDLSLAKDLGYEIKLLASAEIYRGFVQASVEPRAIESSHPLACVDGSTNALMLDCELAGRVGVTGPGAGGRETASAVLADIRRATLGIPGPQYRVDDEGLEILPRKDDPASFIVRCLSVDSDGEDLVRDALLSQGIGVERIGSTAAGAGFEVGVLTGIAERDCIPKALSRVESRGVGFVSALKVWDER